ncbi:MAG: hypothetical protein K5917_06265 [Clostridiales bacterium]|nr:hypothetical protein [Clostridiales bacterium]
MKKKIRLLGVIFAIALTLAFTSMAVKAGEVSTVNVTAENNTITVSGDAADDVAAVTIQVYDETGSNLLAMKTTSVDDNNKYSQAIELANGTYTVKAANYSGGNFIVKENVVVDSTAISNNGTGTETANGNNATATETEATGNNATEKSAAKTGDSFTMGVSILTLAALASTTALVISKKKSK